jgi:hypothetical protein
MIDRACEGITDSAELFAVGMRISGRLGWTHPDIAGFLTGESMDALDSPTAWPVPLEYLIEWLTCAFVSRPDVVLVSLPGAAQDATGCG